MLTPSNGSSAAPQTMFVVLGFRGFAFWWTLILGVHLLTFIFNACYAKFYLVFGEMFLSYSVESYHVGMTREYFSTIAYVHVVLAAAHGGFVLLMVIGSIRRRTLAFSPWSDSVNKRGKRKGLRNERDHNGHLVQFGGRRSTIHMLRRAASTYANIANRRGVLGVNGRYFYAILICREIVETSFQTVQAFRMSKYLSRGDLNRFYVSLLVINCWSSVLVHTRQFGKDEARRRFIAIVCDCVLDLMSSMGVSIMIVLSYVGEYDPVLTGFGFALLENDDWMAQMLDETRLVLVSSWFDLISRIIFSLGIILTTASMKELLRWKVTRGNRVHHARGPSRENLRHLAPLPPLSVPSPQSDNESKTYSLLIPQQFRCNDARLVQRMKQIVFTSIHSVFFMWGGVVLALHIQASMTAPMVECNPKVYPMAGAHPACFAVEFNCFKVGISGRREEVIAEWNRIDHTTVVKLHVRHCPEFEMPEMFQKFIRLREIWVYNSTIRGWGPEAAVTNSCHPNLTVLSLVRTNLTDGLLPLGLQSMEFPINLTEIYFCETNLQALPDDLDTKWNRSSNLYLENSKFTEVPRVLVRLQPTFLSLAGSPIKEIRAELFEATLTQYYIFSHTNVSELPRNVSQLSTTLTLDFRDTNIAFFWSWIDPFVESTLGMSSRLTAGGSPYCSDLIKILGGNATEFSVPIQPDHSSILMNATKENHEVLRQVVDCTPSLTSTHFPLELWDSQYAISLLNVRQ